jgi:hypothetical protein
METGNIFLALGAHVFSSLSCELESIIRLGVTPHSQASSSLSIVYL